MSGGGKDTGYTEPRRGTCSRHGTRGKKRDASFTYESPSSESESLRLELAEPEGACIPS